MARIQKWMPTFVWTVLLISTSQDSPHRPSQLPAVSVLSSLYPSPIFPLHLLPSPVHPTGFSFCYISVFLAIFILLPSINNNLYEILMKKIIIQTVNGTSWDWKRLFNKIWFYIEQNICLCVNQLSMDIMMRSYMRRLCV